MIDRIKLALERAHLPENTLAKKTVVITGAGRGIGRAAAIMLGLLGARIAVAEITAEGEVTARDIDRLGGKAIYVKTDVSSVEDMSKLAQAVRRSFGAVDILINNAAVTPVTPVSEMTVEQWDQVMGVNLRGMFLGCQAFLPSMLARRSGLIINMVSAESFPYITAYITSKVGMAAFSQSLAAEVGEQGVRVIALGPGMVDTPAIREVGKRLAPRIGMTPQQFFSVSLDPAYPGLMPVEDAALAIALLVAQYADDYHSEVVTGYDILKRAHYLPSEPEMAAAGVQRRSAASPRPTVDPLQRSFELAQQIEGMLTETAEEFGRLPAFARPLARQGFKKKSGKSLEDWRRAMIEFINLVRDAGFAPEGRRLLLSRLPGWRKALVKLESYYRSVPAATATMTRDQEFLRQVHELTEERLQVFFELSEALDRLR